MYGYAASRDCGASGSVIGRREEGAGLGRNRRASTAPSGLNAELAQARQVVLDSGGPCELSVAHAKDVDLVHPLEAPARGRVAQPLALVSPEQWKWATTVSPWAISSTISIVKSGNEVRKGPIQRLAAFAI